MKKTISIIMLTLLLASALLTASPVNATVIRVPGVKPGDWGKYELAVNYTTDDPNPPVSPPPPEFADIEYYKIEVLSVQGTNINFQITIRFKNGTETLSSTMWTDVAGGGGNVSPSMFIAANLTAGDMLYSISSPTINATLVRNYAGAEREANYLGLVQNSSYSGYLVVVEMHMYWDRATGILDELVESMQYTDLRGGYQTYELISLVMKETNVWVPFRPLTSRELKKDALAELEAAKGLTADKHTLGKFDNAIEEVEESLNPILWVDDLHLDSKHGKKVFDEEKVAVGQLMEIVKDKKESPAIENATQAVIDKLIKADQLLTGTAISDAKALGSADCRVIREIKKAEEEFSGAIEEIKKANYDLAVEEFRNAWMHAQHAMEKAFGDVNADGKVDVKDITIVAIAFGSSLGQSNWNSAADLNGDNRANVKDLALVCMNFGNNYN
jgi:hypothetical protein